LEGIETFSGDAGFAPFLAGSDMLVCLLPLTAGTRAILGSATLRQLPEGAVLVNIARGGHMVEADVLALLDAGHLGAAVLDVFADEPLAADSPLWRHPRVTVTPHISAMTLVAESMAQIAGKIRALEQGLPVAGVIDRARGY
jgi:glyoxylate/hydroxypyruvate reductase A